MVIRKDYEFWPPVWKKAMGRMYYPTKQEADSALEDYFGGMKKSDPLASRKDVKVVKVD